MRWPGQGAGTRYRGGHLCSDVEDYLDNRFSPLQRKLAARHLICCRTCQQEVVDAERLRARLRATCLDAGREANLVAELLALGGERAVGPTPAHPQTTNDHATRPREAMVIPASAPPQYSRRPRGPVAGVAAIAAVVGVLGTAMWAHPQQGAPSDPQQIRQAKQTSGAADRIVSVSVEKTRPTPGHTPESDN